jgi:hypothetical protein
VRVQSGGSPVLIELWRMSLPAFGLFVASLPPPLVLGNVELDTSECVKGFMCEPYALEQARDATSSGSWRNYLIQQPWLKQPPHSAAMDDASPQEEKAPDLPTRVEFLEKQLFSLVSNAADMSDQLAEDRLSIEEELSLLVSAE